MTAKSVQLMSNIQIILPVSWWHSRSCHLNPFYGELILNQASGTFNRILVSYISLRNSAYALYHAVRCENP